MSIYSLLYIGTKPVSTMKKLAYIFSVIARKNDEAISPRHVGSLAGYCFLVPRRNDVIIIFVNEAFYLLR